MSERTTEKTIYFIRHGESVDNASPVYQSPDSPLSEQGKEQARSLSERILKIQFETLISSTFQRAKETAEYIAQKTGKRTEYSDIFVERMKPTSLNGKRHDNKVAAELWKNWDATLYESGIRVEDGENFDDLIKRADNALAFLEKRKEKSLVVVTHGYFLRVLIARMLLRDLISGEILRKIQQGVSMENTGITVFLLQRQPDQELSWHLWIYNDHAHLGE